MKRALLHIVLCAFIFFSLSARTPAQDSVFPVGGDFNGMTISYSITGASAISVKDPKIAFTWIRTVTGTLGSGRLRVSGTAKSQGIPSYPTDVAVRVWAGETSREFSGRIAGDPSISPRPQFPLGFDVAVDIPASATTGGFSIALTGHYNVGPRGLAVEGAFSRSGAPPPSPASPSPPKPPLPATHDTFDEAADAVAEHIHSLDDSCLGKAVSLGDPDKFRRALNPKELIIEDGTTEAEIYFATLGRSANASTLVNRSVGLLGAPLRNLMYLRFKVPVAGGDAKLNTKQKETLWHESVHHIEALHGYPQDPDYAAHKVYKERNGAYLDGVYNALTTLAGIERTLRTKPDRLNEEERAELKDKKDRALLNLADIPEEFRKLEAGEATRAAFTGQLGPTDRKDWPPDLRALRAWAGINIRLSDILDRYASGACGEELKDFALKERARLRDQGGQAQSGNLATASSLVKQGQDYNEKTQYAQAVGAFTKAIEANPKSAEAYAGRGLAKRSLRDYAAASADFNQAIALDPRNSEAYRGRSMVKRAQNDLSGALADANRVVELAPNFDRAYLTRGLAREGLKDLAGALSDYSRAISLDPSYAMSHFYRAHVRFDSKDYAGALADYNRYIEMNAKNSAAFNNRGLAKERLGDTTGALADYQQAIAINPNDETAKRNLAKLREAIAATQSGSPTLGGSTPGTTTTPSSHPHVVVAADGNLQPAPGYRWVNDAPGDLRVTWSPGKPHPQHSNVVAGATEGRWEPAPGYRWVNDDTNDLRVVPKDRGADVAAAPEIGRDISSCARELVLYTNNNIAGVQNGPTQPTRFQLTQPTLVTYLMSYHWNNGRGQPPGTIVLRHQDGTTYGGAAGSAPGSRGAPNAYWIVRPNVVLKSGIYTVVDSHPSTWAQNAQSNGQGIVEVKGCSATSRPVAPVVPPQNQPQPSQPIPCIPKKDATPYDEDLCVKNPPTVTTPERRNPAPPPVQ